MFSTLNYTVLLICSIYYSLFSGLSTAVKLLLLSSENRGFIARLLKSMFVHLLTGFVISIFMAFLVRFFIAITFLEGVESGFLVWAGIVIPMSLNQQFSDKRSWSHFAVDKVFQLIALCVIGGLLTVWR